MTREEIQAKTQEKVNQIKALCNVLQVSVTAEQAITENGLIRNVVYYMDNEQYEVIEEEVPVVVPEVVVEEEN